MAKKFNSFNAANMAKKYAMKAYKQQQKEQERIARKEAERLLKEQQKPFVESWYKATRKLSSRITYLRNKGYDIEYNTIKPKVITQEDIDYINSLKSKQLLELQSNNLIDIQVSKTDKPTTVNSNRFNPKTARKELNELGYDNDFIDSALSSGEFSGLKDYYEFVKGSAEEIKADYEEYLQPVTLNTEQGAYTVDPETGEILSEPKSGKAIQINSEYGAYTVDPETGEILSEPTTGYFVDKTTGEILAENDPHIWEKSKNGWHLKRDLEYHSNVPISGEAMEQIKWDNFIMPYDKMNKYSYINARDFFNELHKEISVSDIEEIMYEMEEEGSNITSFEFWYSEEFEEFFEKLDDMLDRIEERFDKDLSDLRDTLNEEYKNQSYNQSRLTRRNFT